MAQSDHTQFSGDDVIRLVADKLWKDSHPGDPVPEEAVPSESKLAEWAQSGQVPQEAVDKSDSLLNELLGGNWTWHSKSLDQPGKETAPERAWELEARQAAALESPCPQH